MENISLQAIADTTVISKINTCIAILGGDAELLSIISSFKSTLANDEVSTSLDTWITSTLKGKETEFKELLEYSNR